jgi:hypothetical protein
VRVARTTMLSTGAISSTVPLSRTARTVATAGEVRAKTNSSSVDPGGIPSPAVVTIRTGGLSSSGRQEAVARATLPTSSGKASPPSDLPSGNAKRTRTPGERCVHVNCPSAHRIGLQRTSPRSTSIRTPSVVVRENSATALCVGAWFHRRTPPATMTPASTAARIHGRPRRRAEARWGSDLAESVLTSPYRPGACIRYGPASQALPDRTI